MPSSAEDADTVERGAIAEHKDGRRFVVEDADGDEIVLGRLGDRLLDECPVEEGDQCIDSDCDGRIGETERDRESMSAHELYCYGCGLNWVERGNTWDEQYVDWPTSFEYNGGAR